MTGDGHQALAFSLGLRSRPHWVRFAGFGTCCASLSVFGFGTSFQISYSGVQFSHPCAIRVLISLASVRELLIMLSTMAVFVSTSWWRCGWKYNRSSRSFLVFFSLPIFDSMALSKFLSAHDCLHSDMFLVCQMARWLEPVWVLLTRQFLVPLRKKRVWIQFLISWFFLRFLIYVLITPPVQRARRNLLLRLALGNSTRLGLGPRWLLNSESLLGAKPCLNGSTCAFILLLLKYAFSSLSLTGLLEVVGFLPSLSLTDRLGVSSWGSLVFGVAGLSPSLFLTGILRASSWEM